MQVLAGKTAPWGGKFRCSRLASTSCFPLTDLLLVISYSSRIYDFQTAFLIQTRSASFKCYKPLIFYGHVVRNGRLLDADQDVEQSAEKESGLYGVHKTPKELKIQGLEGGQALGFAVFRVFVSNFESILWEATCEQIASHFTLAHSIAQPTHFIAQSTHFTAHPTHFTVNTFHSTNNIFHSTDNIFHSTDNTFHSTDNTYHSTANTFHNTT